MENYSKRLKELVKKEQSCYKKLLKAMKKLEEAENNLKEVRKEIASIAIKGSILSKNVVEENTVSDVPKMQDDFPNE